MESCLLPRHYCTHVKAWSDFDAALGPYLLGGIELNEETHLYSDRWTLDRLLEEIPSSEDEKKSFIAAAKKGQLQVHSAATTYLRDGHFDVDGMLALVGDTIAQALANGFSGFRAASEMQWVQQATNPNILGLVMNYENLVQKWFLSGQITALCVYCEESLSADFCFRNFHTHENLHVIDKAGQFVLVNPLKVYNATPGHHLMDLNQWISYLRSLGLNWISRLQGPSKDQFVRQIYHDLSRYINNEDFLEKGVPDLFLQTSILMQKDPHF